MVEEVAEKLRSAGFDAAGVVDKEDAQESIPPIRSRIAWPSKRRAPLLGNVAESVARHAPRYVEIVQSAAPQT